MLNIRSLMEKLSHTSKLLSQWLIQERTPKKKDRGKANHDRKKNAVKRRRRLNDIAYESRRYNRRHA